MEVIGSKGAFVSIPFRAVTGFELIFEITTVHSQFYVSIPFRAVTGFERIVFVVFTGNSLLFQSLSGLSLGLNSPCRPAPPFLPKSFNPFQGCHWV